MKTVLFYSFLTLEFNLILCLVLWRKHRNGKIKSLYQIETNIKVCNSPIYRLYYHIAIIILWILSVSFVLLVKYEWSFVKPHDLGSSSDSQEENKPNCRLLPKRWVFTNNYAVVVSHFQNQLPAYDQLIGPVPCGSEKQILAGLTEGIDSNTTFAAQVRKNKHG